MATDTLGELTGDKPPRPPATITGESTGEVGGALSETPSPPVTELIDTPTVTPAFAQSEYLTPPEVARDFKIPIETQSVWRCHNRYGWGDLTIRAGRKILYRRADILAWLESRRGLAT